MLEYLIDKIEDIYLCWKVTKLNCKGNCRYWKICKIFEEIYNMGLDDGIKICLED